MTNHAAPTIRRLGVLGDVHGEHGRLAAALDWFAGQRLDAVICTGDVADGAGCINRCCELLREARVVTVAGNHDRWLLNDEVRHVTAAHRLADVDAEHAEYLRALPRTCELSTVAGRLLLCHGIGAHDMAKVWPGTRGPDSIRRSDVLDRLLDDGRFRFMVHGHLHYGVLIDFESLLLMNAGTLKGSRGGVSVVDFESAEVASFEFSAAGRLQRRAVHPLAPPAGRRIWRSTAEFDGCWEPVLL